MESDFRLAHAAGLAPGKDVLRRRMKTVQGLKEKVVVPIDSATGEVFGRLAAALSGRGRGGAAHRVQDVWMAVQAIQHGLRPIAFNRIDFDDIPGLDLHVLRHAQAR